VDRDVEQLEATCSRQYQALATLNDEVMSILHAQALRQKVVTCETVAEWLRGLYDIVQQGLGRPRHFNPT
jgi:hypothetical protein